MEQRLCISAEAIDAIINTAAERALSAKLLKPAIEC
jgi:hypothetical protein